ncbi:MAG: glycoside hydrolase family 3 N-terminal domain-containing protein [Bacteroidales bacterium]
MKSQINYELKENYKWIKLVLWGFLFCIVFSNEVADAATYRRTHKHTRTLSVKRVSVDTTLCSTPDSVWYVIVDSLYWQSDSSLFTPAINRIMEQMSLEEKIAQTMIVRSENNFSDEKYVQKMTTNFQKYGFGGVCFFKGQAIDMIKLASIYKATSKIPLFVTIDGEWGPGMRLTDVCNFPRQQVLGALQNDSLIYRMGSLVGEQCRRLGIHWNFIPVVDINNNPLNPVINTRSFGQDREEVANKGIAYYLGMKSQGILGSAKHFPGHGDTKTDSHFALPVINHDRETIDSLDLYPFKKMISSGVESVMVGHLYISSIDTTGLPASLSPIIVDSLLRKALNYRGLIVTDGLEMKAARVKEPSDGQGETEIRALLAGVDMLLLPLNPLSSIEAIVSAIKTKRLPYMRLDLACRRILKYKTDSSFLQFYRESISNSLLENLYSKVNLKEIEVLNREIFEQGVTLVENHKNILPLKVSSYPRTACLHIGDSIRGTFESFLDKYAYVKHFYLHRNFDSIVSQKMLDSLSEYNLCIVSVTNTNYTPLKDYGITPETIALISRLQTLASPLILSVFAPPYSLSLLDTLREIDAILVGYQELVPAQEVVAQIIYGGLPACGKLPVSVGARWPVHTGISTNSCSLAYKYPEEVGWHSSDLLQIDSLARQGIDSAAYPGCQILVAKNGAVVYNKVFGRETYDTLSNLVQVNSVYDLASLTKIMATTLVYMKMYEEGLYDLDDAVSLVLHHLRKGNKKKISFRQLLSHQSGLRSGWNYVDDSVFNGYPLFSINKSSKYSIKIADSLYLQKDYIKKIKKDIDVSEVNPHPSYLYSDLGFFYLNEAVKHLSGMEIDRYLKKHFYDSLGLKLIGFHPLERIPQEQIMPTEKEETFRHRLLRGYVHDPLVALMGGVGGSAGLFSNVEDLAVLCQMLLQNGSYGGVRYLDSSTIALFTNATFSAKENRRGGGFDKPPLENGQASPCCASASKNSYGHSGFTGTYFWIDPDQKLVYIFLSNRVYPVSFPNKLSNMNIRTNIQECLYKF